MKQSKGTSLNLPIKLIKERGTGCSTGFGYIRLFWLTNGRFCFVILILQLLFSRESFEKTKAAEDHVIAGWKPKVEA